MAERASVFQTTQIGVEVTPGTAVPANKRLLCTSIEPTPNIPIEPYRPLGGKFPTTVTKQKEFTSAALSGVLCYTDIIYLLSGLLGAGTITTPPDALIAKTWTFKPNMFSADVVKTFTIETGSNLLAEEFAYGLITGLGMRFSSTEASLSGTMIGQKLTESTITAGPTDLTELPVSPDTVGILTLDDTEPSFSAHVERAPSFGASLVVEQNSDAQAYMTAMRAKQTKFLQLIATGDEIEDGINYEIKITFPFKFRNPQRGDNNDVYAGTYELVPIYNSTFGTALEIAVTTSLATL